MYHSSILCLHTDGVSIYKMSKVVCGQEVNLDLSAGSGLVNLIGNEGGISGENKGAPLLKEIRESPYHQKNMAELNGRVLHNILLFLIPC